LYKNRKETGQKEKQYAKDTKTRIHKIGNKNTKQTTNINIILKKVSLVIRK
jgi:hypothetical protein